MSVIIDDYRVPPLRTYRVDITHALHAADAVAERGDPRPSLREAWGLALVELTWRWRDTYAPLNNARRLSDWRRRVTA